MLKYKCTTSQCENDSRPVLVKEQQWSTSGCPDVILRRQGVPLALLTPHYVLRPLNSSASVDLSVCCNYNFSYKYSGSSHDEPHFGFFVFKMFFFCIVLFVNLVCFCERLWKRQQRSEVTASRVIGWSNRIWIPNDSIRVHPWGNPTNWIDCVCVRTLVGFSS